MMLPLLLATAISWQPIQTEVEYAKTGTLHVVRVDLREATVVGVLASQEGVAPRTAAQWCRTARLVVATNLGMFNTDHRTHTGYLRNGRHVNNAHWNDYRSVVAVRPRAPALWVDLDASKKRPAALEQYDLVVQNLRLIAGGRRNVWAKSEKRWSEAALAIDSKGRLLFLFSRAPYTMRDFNKLIVDLPLDVQQAMHLEGGPEASLSIHVPGFDLDLSGSYETGFVEDDSNRQQWAIPNVLGVARK